MEEQDVAKKLKELCGLRKWTEEQARFVLEACRASGEPPTTFARRWGFYSQRMYWWKERFRRTDAEASDPGAMAATSTSTFLPMTVRDEHDVSLETLGAAFTAVAPVTVVVSPDVRIEVTELDAASAAWVAALVKSLREVSP